MYATRSVLVALALVVVAALAACHRDPMPIVATTPVEPAPAPLPRPDPQQLSRGSYVVALAGCNVCHGRAFAGWLGPNITPDRETGIGIWSDTQIITALRRGRRPDGSKLAPQMPSQFFHHMTDADARAVVTYLRTIAPAKNLVGRRPPLRPMADLPEPVDNVDPSDDPREHGKYLANLMHCGSCHTPHEGPQANQEFAGGVSIPTTGTESVMSANLTSDPETGIGLWTEADIIAAIKTGRSSHGEIHGPMRAYVDGWSRLDDADARALVAYLKAVPAVKNQVPGHGPRH